ncbi:MAG: LPS export ABC transporter periplasmic protein LptC [Flavobacteriaceae bacterium]|jgi:LPS export ABC transporter protein LptC|nr:LPS export ABC transporter periplasmic protein LptC [Flavobacteriaceae bacterium]MBT6127363.1 LPS export ABC transporter periplasmic protein LptC [Flavobacteriaceae bacterium]MCH1453747.1 LPS export ABC transporter periplasmic protein LptC [Flavobacteriaceae bacterium]MDG1027783.1 LPS export ABC transporter periplasmic protein LptC [Flavobacteriaceae bacterium]MDG1941458.1 LPS export ABC transporter periplasmic protein LptC [Flavobacteriaceae bacterium]|tara:strand:- start:2190 stop:2777 length:588 start_codon:yes stop_codon:yes gene_type:complete
MQPLRYKFLKKGFSVLAVTLFFSCDDGSSILKQINQFNENPVGIAYDIRMTYTDSAKVKAILTAPINLDYTHLSFKYSEFPEGLKIIFYNDNNEENTVVADYGILYNQTRIVDLQGNVVLLSNSGSRLETSQMYWDSEKEWLFTEQPFTFKSENEDMAATRLDTNKEFSKFQTGKLTGTMLVEEQKDSLTVDEKL